MQYYSWDFPVLVFGTGRILDPINMFSFKVALFCKTEWNYTPDIYTLFSLLIRVFIFRSSIYFLKCLPAGNFSEDIYEFYV